MEKNEIYLFCEGKDCLLKEQCQRYVLGKNIDADAPGYSWMSNCDIEHRSGFITTNK